MVSHAETDSSAATGWWNGSDHGLGLFWSLRCSCLGGKQKYAHSLSEWLPLTCPYM